MRFRRQIVPSLRAENAAQGIGVGVVQSSSSSPWLLDWPTYGRNVSWSYPGSYTKTITTAADFVDLMRPGGSINLVDGDVVHVVGPMTLGGVVGQGGCVYMTQHLVGTGADIYLDSNVVFAGDTNTSQALGSLYYSAYIDGSGMRLYGGTITGGNGPGLGVGPGLSTDTVNCTNIRWWGVTIHDIGGGGIYVSGARNPSGTWLWCDGIDLDAEVYNIGLDIPPNESHVTRPGTGIHALYVGGSSIDPVPAPGYSVTNSKFSLYAHDISHTFGDAQMGQANTSSVEMWLRANNLTFVGTFTGNQGYDRSPVYAPWDNGTNVNSPVCHTIEANGTIMGPMVLSESQTDSGSAATVEHGRGRGFSLADPVAASYFGGHGGTYQTTNGGGATTKVTYTDCLA